MLSLKQLIKTGFTTAQARALVAQQPAPALMCQMTFPRYNYLRRSFGDIEPCEGVWTFDAVLPLTAGEVITGGLAGGGAFGAGKLKVLYASLFIKKVADNTGVPVSSGAQWMRELDWNPNGYDTISAGVLGAGSGSAGYADSGTDGITVTNAGWYHIETETDWARA